MANIDEVEEDPDQEVIHLPDDDVDENDEDEDPILHPRGCVQK